MLTWNKVRRFIWQVKNADQVLHKFNLYHSVISTICTRPASARPSGLDKHVRILRLGQGMGSWPVRPCNFVCLNSNFLVGTLASIVSLKNKTAMNRLGLWLVVLLDAPDMAITSTVPTVLSPTCQWNRIKTHQF